VPIMSQMGACEALVGPKKPLEDMIKEYERRREFVIDRLNEIGLCCHNPQGAFYAFPSVKGTGMSSGDFATKLLKEEKVALVPGTAFGPEGEGYVRISYATNYNLLKEAFERIENFLKKNCSCKRSKKR
nr:aminotransferase class I/II-fold pyridoxal phosphate-dependent enzyme [Candidatus Omnitrophota bacterium]